MIENSIIPETKTQDVELSDEHLRSVSGGKHLIPRTSSSLTTACATGEHIRQATVTHR